MTDIPFPGSISVTSSPPPPRVPSLRSVAQPGWLLTQAQSIETDSHILTGTEFSPLWGPRGVRKDTYTPLHSGICYFWHSREINVSDTNCLCRFTSYNCSSSNTAFGCGWGGVGGVVHSWRCWGQCCAKDRITQPVPILTKMSPLKILSFPCGHEIRHHIGLQAPPEGLS